MVFFKKTFPYIFPHFQENNCPGILFKEIFRLQVLWHRCFPSEFPKSFKIMTLQKSFEQPLWKWLYKMFFQEYLAELLSFSQNVKKTPSFYVKQNHSLIPDKCFQVYKSFICVHKINQWVQYILEGYFVWGNFSSIKTNVYITTYWTTETLGALRRFTQNFRWWSGKKNIGKNYQFSD